MGCFILPKSFTNKDGSSSKRETPVEEPVWVVGCVS
jgi:hypothetical protein